MIQLKDFQKEDICRLITWTTDEKFLIQWAGNTFRYPLTENQILKDLEECRQTDTKKIYRIEYVDSGEVVGHCEIFNIDQINRSARLVRILIGQENARGQGIGLKAVNELLKICFTEYKLHRVDLGVFDFNIAAIKCYENAGFQKEGLLRDKIKVADEYWSIYNMSILANEYELKKC